MSSIPSLRTRIAGAFNDDELRDLCFDHFGAVGGEFTAGMTKGQMIHLLLGYCVRRGLGSALLDVLERERPGLIGADRERLLAQLNPVRLHEAPSNLPAAASVSALPFDHIPNGASHPRQSDVRLQTVPPQSLSLGSPLQTLHQLRAPVSDFIGRIDEIEQLTHTLRRVTESNVTAAIVSLHGPGGVGKTELALFVANRLADLFPDAQLVIDLHGMSAACLTPTQIFQSIIRAFQPGDALSDDEEQLQRQYRALLYGKHVLIVADNARDAVQVCGLLPPPGCALLITSRQRFTLSGVRSIDVAILPTRDAEDLLRSICPRIGDSAARLAQLCGQLPLALRISASTLASDSTWNLTRYLQALERERLRYLSDPDAPDDPQTSVEASLSLSYQALQIAEQQVLCQLSVFVGGFDLSAAQQIVSVPDVVAGSEMPWVFQAFQAAGLDFEQPAMDTNPQSDASLSVVTVLSRLYRRNLVEYDLVRERYYLHDLIRIFAQGRLQTTAMVSQRHAKHYLQVVNLANWLYQTGHNGILAGLTLFDRERENIDAGWRWVRDHIGDVHADMLFLNYANATPNIGALRYDMRHERIPQFELALSVAERIGIKSYQSVFLGNLGFAYTLLGDFHQALHCHTRRLTIAREMDDSPGEAQALSGLGIIYRHVGNTMQAIECHQRALKIAQQSKDRALEGNSLLNLGLVYADSGKAHSAIKYCTQALAIARERGDSLMEEKSLIGLGIAYHHLRVLHTAQTYIEQALGIARSIGDRRTELMALGDLGNISRDRGEVQQANAWYDEALQLAHAINDQLSIAFCSWNLGELLASQGQIAHAIELMQVRVDYYRQLGHAQTEQFELHLAQIRARIGQ